MSDRKDSYFLQLVDEAFFDACFDDLEAADRALAVDMGFIGIVSGVVATQHSPTADLTIDITAGVSYDQAGRRCEITSAVNGFDCSVDENAASTAVASPGNERWLSVQLRFNRTLTGATVDGNGNTVYTDQDESYTLAVVMAGEYALGTNTKPALPTDGRLVCDIHLVNGQTQIFTSGDIFTDRRQDFSIFSAGDIPVSSGSWVYLSPATDDVQAVFDFIDPRMIQADTSQELIQNLIPDTPGRHLGTAAKEWDLYVLELVTVAASRVDGNLIPKADGNDLGTAALQWSLYSDYVELSGNLKTNAASRVDGNVIPLAGGNDLGSTALRWDSFMNTATIYTKLAAAVGGEPIGDSSNRFVAHLNTLTLYNSTLINSLVFNSARDLTKTMDISPLEQPTWSASTWAWLANGSWGGRTITGWTYSSGAATSGDISLDFADGITIKDLALTWYQASGTATLAAELFEVNYQGTETSKGSKTIGATGSWQDKEAMGIVDFQVDRTQYKYILRITGVASIDCALVDILLTATATDVARAAVS
jgi:hypothetical protein